MGLWRSVAIGMIVVLISVSLLGANATVAAERTALDSTFVTTTLSEENAYQALQLAVIETATDELGVAESDVPIDPEPIVEEAVPPTYIEGQVDRNIERLYAYLHGDRGDLVLTVNLVPVKENVPEVIEDEIKDRSVDELFGLAGIDDLGSVEVEGVSIDLSVLGDMGESEAAYQSAKESFRADLRDKVIEELVNEAFETRSKDELLALVIDNYDPDAYSEDEKEAMVTQREDEIRAALRDIIEDEYGDEIDARLNAELDDYRDEVRPRIQAVVEEKTGDGTPALTNATVELAMVGVEGLLTDMEYAEFRTQLDAAKADLAAAVSDVVAAQLAEEAPDKIDLTEELPAETEQDIEAAQNIVGIVDLLSVGFPVAAIGFLGLLWILSGSVVMTAIGAGVGLFVAGVSGVAAAVVVPNNAQATLASRLPPELAEASIGVIDQTFAVVFSQSLGVTAAGVVVTGVAGLVYLGVVPVSAGDAD